MNELTKTNGSALIEATLPVGRGQRHGDWFDEEHVGAVRLGLRFRELLHEEQSPFQKLSVYDTAFFGRILALDDVIMLTERDEFVYHEMLIHVPLCSIPAPRAVLIIGGGDCGALREALKHPGLERVVQCDIDERVTRVSERFFPWVDTAVADPRAELVFEDGVAYIERHREEFDLIAIDSTDPIGPAAGLFAGEFYARVIRALRPDGVMSAQTESPHWNPDLVGAIYREMKSRFTRVDAYGCAIPTYPSGYWTMAYASTSRGYDAYFDETRATALESSCRYYNRAIHKAAFALPTFAREVVHDGSDPFAGFTSAQRTLLDDPTE